MPELLMPYVEFECVECGTWSALHTTTACPDCGAPTSDPPPVEFEARQ